MKRHTAREWTVEEFDDWAAATDRHGCSPLGLPRGESPSSVRTVVRSQAMKSPSRINPR